MIALPRYTRLVVSYTATALLAGWCSGTGRFHIEVTDLQTWANAFADPFGRAMLLCGAWAGLELLLAMAMPREQDELFQPSHA